LRPVTLTERSNRVSSSADKAARSFGYSPRPAKDALRDAVAWFRETGHFI
jgi:hypothetical protein